MRIPTLLTLVIVFMGSALKAQYRSDSCGCPRPRNDPKEGEGSFGRNIPATDFMWQKSIDGKLIGYFHSGEGLSILDLVTLGTRHLHQEVLLANHEVPKSMYHPHWSPYESDVLMFKVVSTVDTSDLAQNVLVQNIYRYNLKTKNAERVTPSFLGRYGASSIGWYGWTLGSSPGYDTIIISLGPNLSPDGKHFYGSYSLQTGKMERLPLPTGNTHEVYYSDGKHCFAISFDSSTAGLVWPGTIDGIPLNFAKQLDTLRAPELEFSPSGKYVVFDAHFNNEGPPGDSLYEQLWICEVTNPANPLHVINLQRLYCTYSFDGLHPHFLTDTTLAISMHKDEAKYSPLWEIKIDGTLLRQLTRIEQSAVKTDSGSERALRVYPNPTNGKLTIDYESKFSGEVMLSVYSVNGVVIHEEVVHSAGKPIQLDTSGWPNGAYTIVLRSGDDEARGSVIKE
jgi:hypothetical protein